MFRVGISNELLFLKLLVQARLLFLATIAYVPVKHDIHGEDRPKACQDHHDSFTTRAHFSRFLYIV